MTRFRSVWALVVAVAAALGAVQVMGSSVRESSDPTLVSALEAYGAGQEPRVTFSSIDDLIAHLGHEGTAWVSAGLPEDRERRREVTALLALDATIDASPSGAQVRLIEWGCDTLRSGHATDFEHTWMQESIAFLEWEHQGAGLLDGKGHVEHAISRFPSDPTFAADIIFGRHEVNVLTRRPLKSPTLLLGYQLGYPAEPPPLAEHEADQKRIADTLEKLRTLYADPVVGPIARERVGILLYELRRFDESRRELAGALNATGDPYLLYLAHLVLGLGFDSEDHTAEAAHEFAAAVAIDPDIRSGASELAQHDFIAGRRPDGSALLDRALVSSPPHDDPWEYPCPDCEGWTKRLADLHAWVRR